MGSCGLAADARSCLSSGTAHRAQKLFLLVLMVVQLRASPFVLIDPSTGRAVEQPRPYWHWSNRVVEQEEEPASIQAGNELDETEATGITQQQVKPFEQSEQLVERAYVRPYTPYVHPRPQEPARSEYISETGTPLYKLRRRNPYGRK